MWGMTVSNPAFLWGLPLAGIPILFHLFYRIRKKERPFSSLLFFVMVDPRMNARRKIREILALLLRMAAMLLFLLALAAPVWRGGHGGGPTDRVLIVDNSASMAAASAGARTRLSRALEAAAALLGAMRPGDRAVLALTVPDAAAALPEGWSADPAALRAALDRIGETEAAGSPANAFALAVEWLASASAPGREIHLFSDLQQGEWDKPAAGLAAPPMGVAVTVHAIAAAPAAGPNVAMAGVTLPARRLFSRRLYEVQATLHNTTPFDADVRLHTAADDGQTSSRPILLPGGRSRTVAIPVFLGEPGPHGIRIWLSGDQFGPDNTAYLGFVTESRAPVLFVGSRSDFGLLPIALSPAGDGRLSGLVPHFAETVAAISNPAPAMVVVHADTLRDPAAPLFDYVRGGGMLLVLPPPELTSAADSLPPWIDIVLNPLRHDEAGADLMAFETRAPLWQEMRDDRGNVSLGGARAFRYRPLTLGREATPAGRTGERADPPGGPPDRFRNGGCLRAGDGHRLEHAAA